MDLRKLKTLIDLVSESNVSELEITEPEGKVRIVKGSGPMAYGNPGHPGNGTFPMGYGQPAMASNGQNVAFVHDPSSSVATEIIAETVSEPIKSPMVGTFYQSASPGAAALVQVGDEVKVGQAVCIIEAMKIMNEIEADRAGRITRILVTNGQAVEFGQPLFAIE